MSASSPDTPSKADDDDKVVPFPAEHRLEPLPEPIVATSEKGLDIVWDALLQQLGPHQAYNRLAVAARRMRNQIPGRPGRPPSA